MRDRYGAAWSEQQVAMLVDAHGRRTSPTKKGIRRGHGPEAAHHKHKQREPPATICFTTYNVTSGCVTSKSNCASADDQTIRYFTRPRTVLLSGAYLDRMAVHLHGITRRYTDETRLAN